MELPPSGDLVVYLGTDGPTPGSATAPSSAKSRYAIDVTCRVGRYRSNRAADYPPLGCSRCTLRTSSCGIDEDFAQLLFTYLT